MAKGSDKDAVIVFKKVKKVAGGHHGGAWKVAYADFVTAMMAFFLLLWLLNVTTDEQKFGIAQYFDPVSVSESQSGSGSILGGQSMVKDGAMISANAPIGIDMGVPGVPETGPKDERESEEDAGGGRTGEYVDESEMVNEITENGDIKFTNQALEQANAQKEQKEFEKAEEMIRQAIQEVPDLKEFAPNLIIDQTPEGLRIQIVDQEGRSMFPLGSARMYDETNRLLALVTDVVKKMPNKISITGHTDSAKYRQGASYNNWDLSADRANAARRALIAAGLEEGRINHVTGKADREHLEADTPMSPRNRRISIVLLREHNFPVAKNGNNTAPNSSSPAQPQQRSTPVPALPQGSAPSDALDYKP